MTTFARFWIPRDCRTYSRTFAHRSNRHLNFRQRTYKSMYLQNYPTILKQSTGSSGYSKTNLILLRKSGARLFLKSIRTIGTQLREYVMK